MWREIWFEDFEFYAPAGERPLPICAVFREHYSGRLIRQWLYDNPRLPMPYAVADDVLVVAFFVSAEMGCHIGLDWPIPTNVIDLSAEFRLRLSGFEKPDGGYGLLGALRYFGLNALDAAEKEGMREIAIRGGPFTATEQKSLLRYCQGDVDSLRDLYNAMQPQIDTARALLRGRYGAAVARMEANGVPIDAPALNTIRKHWEDVQDRLIESVDNGRGIYDGRHFRTERFASWLESAGIPWPHLESGNLDLSDGAFRTMALAFPEQIGPLRELRTALSQLRLESLAVGSDDRNRCLLSPFCSRTGRNQPSNTRFIFGPSTWLRSLIRPPEGKAVAYIDWEQQEFGIAAALSGDPQMQTAYLRGDSYLQFAIQAHAAPPDATKETHKAVREQFKTLSLAVQYGMREETLAGRLNTNFAHARMLIELHRNTYPGYWRWSDSAEIKAMLGGSLTTTFGWKVHADARTNPRSLRNFPLQANGAEMLRLACMMATEAGIRVAAPVHDALLIETDIGRVEQDVQQTQALMRRASEYVLAGFPLRTDAQVVRHPDRYVDSRGKGFWDDVWKLIGAEHLNG